MQFGLFYVLLGVRSIKTLFSSEKHCLLKARRRTSVKRSPSLTRKVQSFMSTPNSSTQKLSDLEREFNRLPENGFIGDPNGRDSVAYLRVSSDEQAEKGSGLLRQLQNVAEVASKRGVKIAWDM